MPKENSNVIPSIPSILEDLWYKGFFNTPQTVSSIAKKMGEQKNNRPLNALQNALTRAKYLTRTGKRNSYKYIQKASAMNSHSEKAAVVLFSAKLTKGLGKDFETELKDLKLNFGRSGICTAFLLRKILEKLIYLTFAHNGILAKLEDKTKIGRYVGLEAMINIASKEKINGSSILMPSTAKQIQGIKFLGDTSAHNPLSNVAMETIILQIPYIVTAYDELLSKF